jgi:hypothetical protein
VRGLPGRDFRQEPDPLPLSRRRSNQHDALDGLADWFDSDSARSSFNLGISIADYDDRLQFTIESWLETGRCRGFVAGYLRGVGTRRGILPTEWSRRLDDVANLHPQYAASVTLDSDFSWAGVQHVMRLFESHAISITF